MSSEKPEQNPAIVSLHKLTLLSLSPSKYLGFTIFSLTPQTRLEFLYCSAPLYFAFSRHFFIIAALLLNRFSEDSIRKFFSFHEQTATETFCGSVIALNSFFADALSTYLVFLKRDKIIHFYQLIVTFFIYHTKDCSAMQQVCSNLFENGCSRVRKFRWVIVVVFLFQLTVLLVLTFKRLSQPPWLDADIFTKTALHFWALLWVAAGTLRFMARIWIISLLFCFKVSAILVKTKLNQCFSETSDFDVGHNMDTKLIKILQMFQEMESLVEKFNDAFGFYLAIDMLSLVSCKVVYIFLMSLAFMKLEWSMVGQDILGLALFTIVLMRICDTAHRFTYHVSSTKITFFWKICI